MRDVTEDPKYNAANNVPFVFHEGEWVEKISGDYTFTGIVVARFRKRSGSPRYVVENEDGVIHIFNHNQLECRGRNR